MPSVSVIIPVYNGEAYIENCFARLQEQTLRDIELVFIDDGSCDHTRELLKQHESEHVKVICQKNGGAGCARNAGIQSASGEYIAFLDVDDQFACKDSLQLLYTQAKEHSAMICGGSLKSETQVFAPENKRIFTKTGWIDFKDYQFDFGFARFVFNREFLISNQITFPTYRMFEDPVFLAKAMITARKFYAVSDVVYLYSGAHQTDLNLQKTIDYLKGLRDLLVLSGQHQYAVLHRENFERLRTSGSYYAELQLESGSPALMRALADANSAVDSALLQTAGVCLEENYLIPALDTIFRTSRKYIRLRKRISGWIPFHH